MFRLISILLGCLVLAGAGQARIRSENPNIPGEAGLRAHRAQKARERMSGMEIPTETRRTRPKSLQGIAPDIGGRSSRGQAAKTHSTGPAALKKRPAAEAKEDPVPVTPVRLAQLKREAKARKAIIQRTAKPIPFRWPSSEQAELQWSYIERQIDGIGETYNILRTPRHTLTAGALEGYKPMVDDNQPNPAGLILGNLVRPDLRLEFYTFRPAAFLPHLEANAVQAYQRALLALFGDQPVRMVQALEAQNEYGPGTADLLTRRVRFRVFPEGDPQAPQGNPVEVVDFLIPLHREWLVVRFFAPPPVFPAASEEVESFLNRLELMEPEMATALR